jgi:hypothetical protein
MTHSYRGDPAVGGVGPNPAVDEREVTVVHHDGRPLIGSGHT